MKSYIKIFVIVLAAIILGGSFIFFKTSKVEQPKKNVVQTPTPNAASISVTLSPSLTVKGSPTTTPVPTVKLSKTSYSIALYGDSLIDTMSDHASILTTDLAEMYPGVNFTIYNYGIGAQNVEAGLQRFTAAFSNRNRVYAPITEIKPDVIIVGSFAYNPFSPHDKEKHKSLLSEIVSKSKATGADVYMLEEIAPLGAAFGDGSVNWEDSQSIEHSNHIIELLQNVPAVAAEQNIKVINVFSLSKVAGSEYGRRNLVGDDGIHPSAAGHALTFTTILSNVVLK